MMHALREAASKTFGKTNINHEINEKNRACFMIDMQS